MAAAAGGARAAASPPRARAAALTAFLGWSAGADRAARRTSEWEAVHRRLHGWARVLRARGVAALIETVTLAEGLPERVLSAADGERRLTDLRHVGQLLHAAATTEQLGTTALAAWLRRRIAEADQDTGDEDRSRRLESDAAGGPGAHDPPQQGPRVPDRLLPVPVGARVHPDPACRSPSTTPTPATGARSTSASRGEDFDRHKRAAPDRGARRGPAARLRRADARQAPGGRVVGAVLGQPRLGARPAAVRAHRDGDGAGDRALRRRATRSPSSASRSSPARRSGASASSARGWRSRSRTAGRCARRPSCVAARFDRALDRRWRRTSFSDITGGAHEPRVASEPEELVLSDEPETPVRPAAAGDAAAAALHATPSLLAAMPAGTSVGTFVHRVLEATDFAAADLDAELSDARRRGAGAAGGRDRRPGRGDRRAARGDRDAARPRSAGCACATSTRADRLDELDFELPLAGGDEPTGRARARRDRRASCASTSPPATRSPATPTASTTRRCAAPCAAT